MVKMDAHLKLLHFRTVQSKHNIQSMLSTFKLVWEKIQSLPFQYTNYLENPITIFQSESFLPSKAAQ